MLALSLMLAWIFMFASWRKPDLPLIQWPSAHYLAFYFNLAKPLNEFSSIEWLLDISKINKNNPRPVTGKKLSGLSIVHWLNVSLKKKSEYNKCFFLWRIKVFFTGFLSNHEVSFLSFIHLTCGVTASDLCFTFQLVKEKWPLFRFFKHSLCTWVCQWVFYSAFQTEFKTIKYFNFVER